MKCQVCGSDYPDDAVTCPKDGNHLRDPARALAALAAQRRGAMLPAYGMPRMGPPPQRAPEPPVDPAKVEAERVAHVAMVYARAEARGEPLPRVETEAEMMARLDAEFAERRTQVFAEVEAAAKARAAASPAPTAEEAAKPIPDDAPLPAPSPPDLMRAYVVPPMTNKPRPLLALLIVAAVLALAALSVMLR